jgi:hypothetical protein
MIGSKQSSLFVLNEYGDFDFEQQFDLGLRHIVDR